MTSGRPVRPAIPHHRGARQRMRQLIAGVVGLHLGAAALWLLLAPGQAAAGSPPMATVPASPSGSPGPSSTTPTPPAPPTTSPTSANPLTPRPSRGAAHHHAPTPSATVAVVAPWPTSSAPPLAGLAGPAQAAAPGRVPDPGSAPRPGSGGAVLDNQVGPPDADRALGGRLDGWWLPGAAATPLIVSGTAALIVAIAGLLLVSRRPREF